MSYKDVRSEDLILRDHLARDRTALANERTLLAYARTALMLVLSGMTCIKLFADDRLYVLAGIIMIPAGVLVGMFGLSRYRRLKHLLAFGSKPTPATAANDADADEP